MSKDQKLIICQGLPASGKTTWSDLQVKKDPNRIKRVNKDKLREMLTFNLYTNETEAYVIAARDALVDTLLKAGRTVIVDDTNLNPIHVTELSRMAARYGATVQIKKFFDVSVDECIARDKERGVFSVGEEVIRNMYNRYLHNIEPEYTAPELLARNESLPKAVIVDIDGTIADHMHHDKERSHYDYSKVHLDLPHLDVINLIEMLRSMGRHIIVVTGRDGSAECLNLTRQWLDTHLGPSYLLYSRAEGDRRKDDIVKEEIYRNNICNHYNVEYVFDDRKRVVDMWRRIGLRCLQVAPGDF